jgi:hypothetical protein
VFGVWFLLMAGHKARLVHSDHQDSLVCEVQPGPDATCHVLPTVALKADKGEHRCPMGITQENGEMPPRAVAITSLLLAFPAVIQRGCPRRSLVDYGP